VISTNNTGLPHKEICGAVMSKQIAWGSYGSWKTWKILEFYCGIFQDWKSWRRASGPGKFWKSVKPK